MKYLMRIRWSNKIQYQHTLMSYIFLITDKLEYNYQLKTQNFDLRGQISINSYRVFLNIALSKVVVA